MDSGYMVLGVDLGATKAQFVTVDAAGRERLRLRYACRDFPGFDDLFARFLAELHEIEGGQARPLAACIGMAGPVRGRHGVMTHLPWTLDADRLAQRSGVERISLVNDFHAAAHGVARLPAQALRELQPGMVRADACRAVVGAGTGLGVATLVPAGAGWRVIAGEGGHVGFAPADEIEIALWRHLFRSGPRVSAERVLSGAGLAAVYAFVCERSGRSPARLLSAGDPAAAVATAALEDGDANPDAVAALDLFASVYGGFVGDVALTVLPRAGVYVAGGIAPKVLDDRRSARFLAAFRAKGRHATLMSEMPVRLVLEPALGAIGAAALAADALAADSGGGSNTGEPSIGKPASLA